jgi:hypothetical protein
MLSYNIKKSIYKSDSFFIKKKKIWRFRNIFFKKKIIRKKN